MKHKSLLLTGAFDWKSEELELLRQAGYELVLMKNEWDPLPPGGSLAETVVCNRLFCHHRLEKFPLLHTIQLVSAGTDQMDLAKIRQRGMILFNAEDAYSIPMAEWVLLRILELYKQAWHLQENQQNHRWEKLRYLPELAGKRALVIGTGHVGRAVAKRLAAFDTCVTGINQSGRPTPEFFQVFSVEHLDEQLHLADILVLALPLNNSTQGIMDTRRLGLLPNGAILVNVARGGLLDEHALVRELENNRILGAALDVFQQEPLPAESPLWGTERVLISSHNSFVGQGNHDRLWRVIQKNLIEEVACH